MFDVTRLKYVEGSLIFYRDADGYPSSYPSLNFETNKFKKKNADDENGLMKTGKVKECKSVT